MGDPFAMTNPNEGLKKHTPTPFVIARVAQDEHFSITGKPTGICWLVYKPEGYQGYAVRLGYFETKEQAEIACSAVNSYEDLTEMRTLLLKAKERFDQGLPLEYSELIKKAINLAEGKS